MSFLLGNYDVIVIGAGHAGCEAALICARMGMNTLALTINMDAVALMACNPAVGGTSKGHLVREVDAMGGEMGLNIDATSIQTRMLNLSKGPAVHSLRAQADKKAYQQRMKWVMENTPGLTLRQGEASHILTTNGHVSGLITCDGAEYGCRAVIVCAGVYLKGRVIVGEYSKESGPSGMFPAGALSGSLTELGLSLMRFKTGTPARVNGRTIDYAAMTPQPGEPESPAFSFATDKRDRPQVPCYLTWTNAHTHEIIRRNLHRSPLFSGDIKGTGPRYCPSIEDKVVRFSDKERHQVFIEPEGLGTQEKYVQGMSTSLPLDVQIEMLRTLPGLEKVELVRPGYAIEYDCLEPTQLDSSLAIRGIPGLFSAGQINGSSGYEEAAAQGIVAGINAALSLKGEPPLIIGRDEGYTGVLIDDLVTKGTREPYRMMTSRAEYRLLLRQDNADLRLTERAYQVGAVGRERYDNMMYRREETEKLLRRLNDITIKNDEVLKESLEACGETLPSTSVRAAELLRRPRVEIASLPMLRDELAGVRKDIIEQVQIELKYAGYLQLQRQEVERFRRQERVVLPDDLDYAAVPGLRIEAAQKLSKQRPRTFGQALRISGVSPADGAALMIHLKRREQQ